MYQPQMNAETTRHWPMSWLKSSSSTHQASYKLEVINLDQWTLWSHANCCLLHDLSKSAPAGLFLFSTTRGWKNQSACSPINIGASWQLLSWRTPGGWISLSSDNSMEWYGYNNKLARDKSPVLIMPATVYLFGLLIDAHPLILTSLLYC